MWSIIIHGQNLTLFGLWADAAWQELSQILPQISLPLLLRHCVPLRIIISLSGRWRWRGDAGLSLRMLESFGVGPEDETLDAVLGNGRHYTIYLSRVLIIHWFSKTQGKHFW